MFDIEQLGPGTSPCWAFLTGVVWTCLNLTDSYVTAPCLGHSNFSSSETPVPETVARLWPEHILPTAKPRCF